MTYTTSRFLAGALCEDHAFYKQLVGKLGLKDKP